MKSFTFLALFSILVGCDRSPLPNAEPVKSTVPKVGSVFVFDYQQHIIPAKKEDVDTTYQFTLSANIVKDGLSLQGYTNAVEVRMLDDNGEVSAMDRYFLATGGPGDVFYNIPYFSGDWIRLPVASQQKVEVSNKQQDGNWSKEASTVSTYLGTENISVGAETVLCQKVQVRRTITETDEYFTHGVPDGTGIYSELWTCWYSPKLKFFAQREADIDSKVLHQPPWHYTRKETLREYTLKD